MSEWRDEYLRFLSLSALATAFFAFFFAFFAASVTSTRENVIKRLLIKPWEVKGLTDGCGCGGY
jgi:hypothetical protein